MTRDALHDFADLRTRPPIPPEQPEKRRCVKCRAFLRSGNTGTLCGPCQHPDGIDLPGWAVELAENANVADLASLGKLLREDLGVGVVAEDSPETDAPLCACGCGARTLRAGVGGGHGHRRIGPWQQYLYGHTHAHLHKGVTNGETSRSHHKRPSE